MLIVFRVDASIQIASGHVMRCMTLAKVLRRRGADCRFICRDHEGNLSDRIRQEGYDLISLPRVRKASTNKTPDKPILTHADWLGTDWHTDAQQTLEALDGESVDWLIVDHYALDKRWETLLRPYAKKIMVIDDLADRDHNCDLLLDQNVVTDLEHRYDAHVSFKCAKLLGPHYGLLQQAYAELHMRTPPRLGPVRRILAFFGGADRHNLTGLALSSFVALQRNDIVLDIVIHPQSQHAAKIREQAQLHENVSVHDILPSLAPLMVKADLAIGAGGATSWERCCLGLPALVITLADNQTPITEELNRLGLVRWIGHFDQVTNQALTQALQLSIEDSGLEDWSRACMSQVDGKGVERVAAIMLLDVNTPLKARLARLSDEELLLSWANDPLVRKNAFNTETITKKVHRQWFYSRLRETERCRIYILETAEGLPIGQVRFECNKDEWEIHYGLAAEARGKTLGKRILQAAMLDFHLAKSEALVFGRVKQENKASQWVFEELGFTCNAAEQQLVYRRML